jgi:uncharacterized membrane-anchored protein YitT (DUF2179 family)
MELLVVAAVRRTFTVVNTTTIIIAIVITTIVAIIIATTLLSLAAIIIIITIYKIRHWSGKLQFSTWSIHQGFFLAIYGKGGRLVKIIPERSKYPRLPTSS